jgi:hypothetical protein
MLNRFFAAYYAAHGQGGIRAAKDTGLRNLPLRGFTQNQIWCGLFSWMAIMQLGLTALAICSSSCTPTARVPPSTPSSGTLRLAYDDPFS